MQTKYMKRLEKMISTLATPERLTVREFLIYNTQAAIVFNPSLSDNIIISCVVATLEKTIETQPQTLLKKVLHNAEAKLCDYSESEILSSVLAGDAAVIVDGQEQCFIIGSKKWDKRAVAEPPTETVQRGPREGFIEDIKTNLSLLERRLKSAAFATEQMVIGRISRTAVALCYISTIASPKLVERIRRKLKSIDVDGIIDSNYLQPLIEPHPNSIMNQTGMTEKPDIVTAKLLEGRVAIIVDGSPIVLTAPFLLLEDFQSGEDYYQRNAFASFLRMLRFAAVLISIFLPGLYVAMQVFHYNIIPVKFLITLMNAVKGIPLSPMPEILFVLLLFEIIRESSVRMPRAVGMAMSIVGGLVLGETAVKSGMISSPAVMIIALSSIALYTAPNEVGQISLLRIAFTLLGGLGGLYGLVLGTVFVVTMLVNFDSFSTPYLAPLAPFVLPDLKDSFYVAATRYHNKRPYSIPNINRTRRK